MPRPPKVRRPELMKREAADKRSVEIDETSPGRVVVKGDLTFATARDARQLGVAAFGRSGAERFEVDCGAVTRADSAGLAVLLDWLSGGRRHSRAVSLQNLPASLIAIARISEVDGLLTAAG